MTPAEREAKARYRAKYYKSQRLFERVDNNPIAGRNPEYDPNRDGPPMYESPSAQLLGDPPIGRRAIDKAGPRA